MTKFYENSEIYGDVLGPIFDITDPEDARQYKEAYIQWVMKQEHHSWEDAQGIVESNIGYCARYSNDPETRNRIHKLFSAEYPYFGTDY